MDNITKQTLQKLKPLLDYVDRRYQKCNWSWSLNSFLTGTNVLYEYGMKFKKYQDKKGNISEEYKDILLNTHTFEKLYHKYLQCTIWCNGRLHLKDHLF